MSAERLKELPPYLFDVIDAMIAKRKMEGGDIISLGIGDPNIPTPKHIVNTIKTASEKPENHCYPSYRGMDSFREAVAKKFETNYNVKLDPKTEVVALIGSKEGINNIHFGIIDIGDVVVYTNPGYPVYRTGPIFAGGLPYALPLKEENNFLPDLEKVPKIIRGRKPKAMWINPLNNPTTAPMPREFLKEVKDFGEDREIKILSDEAYSGITYDDYKFTSLLEIDGAREICVVFDSLSKYAAMTGWRIGYCVGNKEIIAALGKVKTNVDSGAPQAIQEGAIAALTGPQEFRKEMIQTYKERRDVTVEGLKKLGLRYFVPKGYNNIVGTFYAWAEVPEKFSKEKSPSMAFSEYVFNNTDVFMTPGVGFGEYGEGWVRLSYAGVNTDRINQAFERLSRLSIS